MLALLVELELELELELALVLEVEPELTNDLIVDVQVMLSRGSSLLEDEGMPLLLLYAMLLLQLLLPPLLALS